MQLRRVTRTIFSHLLKHYKVYESYIPILEHALWYWNLFEFYEVPVIEVFGSVFKGEKIKHFKSQHLVSEAVTPGRCLWLH